MTTMAYFQKNQKWTVFTFLIMILLILTSCDGSGSGGSESNDTVAQNTYQPWPGRQNVEEVDIADSFAENLSGLHYQPGTDINAGILWAVMNRPAKIYRLIWDGATWVPESGEWSAGKALTFPTNSYGPDAEGITKAEWDRPGIYISSEMITARLEYRLSVLRYDETSPGGTLAATNEWVLSDQLPSSPLNQGLEAITWIPDKYLVASGFIDNLTGEIYNPAQYPGHGSGLFVVGLEATGQLFMLALNHLDNTSSILATIDSGLPKVMSLEFDRETAQLWAGCDNTCDNKMNVLHLDQMPGSCTSGRFIVGARFYPPSGLPNSNHEGIALLPESECIDGFKGFFWADDSNSNHHAIRFGSIPCVRSF